MFIKTVRAVKHTRNNLVMALQNLGCENWRKALK